MAMTKEVQDKLQDILLDLKITRDNLQNGNQEVSAILIGQIGLKLSELINTSHLVNLKR
ncbi:hypothetical protein [Belnapia moabensis]|uniref:hypothetical protein n=1 Tax=Belnapia moabensis TaxID=365533 RepID=UPI0014704F3B|nr:hypothetical protein [Belnapia moabensis]